MFVLVVSVEGDAEEASAVVHTAQTVGWTVRELILAPFDRDAAQAGLIERAACVIVVWSALAQRSRALSDIAEATLAAGKLVGVQVDNTAAPEMFDRALDIAHWREGIDTRTRHRLLSSIQAIAGTPPTNAPPPRRTWRRAGAAALLAVSLAIAALGASLAWDAYRAQTEMASQAEKSSPPPTAPPRDQAAGDQAAGAAAFAEVDRADAMSLQAFLKVHSTGAAAAQARADLAALELQSWSDITQAPDSLAALTAIAKYRSTYPSGR
ncbi:MAG: hypothetical protein EBZ50_10400, partial [Alphaproteobacteria bacterium]|nr:hypothetical protein [Alphaproteobacteria bacterium]